MADRIYLEEKEFTQFLSLQLEAHNHLQQKARNLLSITIAATIAIATLLSVGMLDPLNPFNLSYEDSILFFQDSFFTQREGEILGWSFLITQKLLFFDALAILTISYKKIFGVYKRTRIAPLISKKDDEFHISINSFSKKRGKQEILNDNTEYIANTYDKYRAGIYLLSISFLFLAVSSAIHASIVGSILLSLYVFLFVILMFLFFYLYIIVSAVDWRELRGVESMAWEYLFSDLAEDELMFIKLAIYFPTVSFLISSILLAIATIWRGTGLIP